MTAVSSRADYDRQRQQSDRQSRPGFRSARRQSYRRFGGSYYCQYGRHLDAYCAPAATLTSNSTTTDSSGQAQTTVNFSASAVGQISVKAALTGANSGISTTFTLSTNVQIASLTKVSGDSQSYPGEPELPRATDRAGQRHQRPARGRANRSASRSAAARTLSATSVPTDASGRAQVTVKAGATPGAVTVTASAGNASQSFTLTVIPPGPALSTSSFYNAGGGVTAYARSRRAAWSR